MLVCRNSLAIWNSTTRSALVRGFNSSWWSKYEEKQYEKKQEQFTKEIASMAGKSSYTLMDFRQRIIDGLNEANKGTIRRMFGNNDQTEAQMIMQRKILNAFFENELLDPDNLTTKAKQDISAVAQCSVQDINMLMSHYRSMRDMQKWLRGRKERGEPLPESQPELMRMFRESRPLNYWDSKKARAKFELKKEDMQRVIKWGYRRAMDYKLRFK